MVLELEQVLKVKDPEKVNIIFNADRCLFSQCLNQLCFTDFLMLTFLCVSCFWFQSFTVFGLKADEGSEKLNGEFLYQKH